MPDVSRARQQDAFAVSNRTRGFEMNYIRMQTHEDQPSIPKGLAALVWDNNGFIGTNNGLPHCGQPALFPLSQARAILICVSYVQSFHPELDECPHPEAVSDSTKKWITGSGSIDHRDSSQLTTEHSEGE